MNSAKILVGDCIDVLKSLDDCSIQTCITSPPYWGLKDYGIDGQIGLEKSPNEYVTKILNVFHEVKRVLKNDGTLWLNLGDSYYNYRPGNYSDNRKQSFGGERIHDRQLPDNPMTSKRGNKIEGLKEKEICGIPWRVAFALQADGWYLRQDIIWSKPNPSPESVKDRCTKSHEYIFLLTKSSKYFYDSEAIKEPVKDKSDNTLKNKRSVWSVPLKPFRGAHFATYPPELIEPCILAGSKSKASDDSKCVVLDPFNGAGTTGLVALNHGRDYIGIELNEDYADMSVERMKNHDIIIDVQRIRKTKDV